jgi:hypothetical protein
MGITIRRTAGIQHIQMLQQSGCSISSYIHCPPLVGFIQEPNVSPPGRRTNAIPPAKPRFRSQSVLGVYISHVADELALLVVPSLEELTGVGKKSYGGLAWLLYQNVFLRHVSCTAIIGPVDSVSMRPGSVMSQNVQDMVEALVPSTR